MEEPRSPWPPISYWMRVGAGLLVVVALGQMVVALQNLLILIGVSLILAIGFQPGVNWLERRGLARGAAVAAIFLTGIVVIGAFLAMVIPTVITQIGSLVDKAPDYIRRAQEGNGFIANINQKFDLIGKLRQLSSDLPSTALSLIRSFTSFLFNMITVLILTLYFTTALPKMQQSIARLLRKDDRADFGRILRESTALVGGYMLGNLLVSLIAGVASFVALLIIGVPYAAAIAFWVALADLIPTVGALLGAGAAVIVAAFSGPPELIATIIFFVVYQQVENYFIAPRIMGKTVEMSAAAVIVAVLIGGSLAGFAGALLALPAGAIVKVTVQELFVRPRLEHVRLSDAAALVPAAPVDAIAGKRRRRPRRRKLPPSE